MSTTYQRGQRFRFVVGSKVICNGYPGTVVIVHGGQLAGMVDVRLDSGDVCTGATYPECYPDDERDPDIKMRAIRVWFADGSIVDTYINGRRADIEAYYRGQAIEIDEGKPTAKVLRVEFVA